MPPPTDSPPDASNAAVVAVMEWEVVPALDECKEANPPPRGILDCFLLSWRTFLEGAEMENADDVQHR